MDWKVALKIAGPSAIAAWVFTQLITHYLNTSEIIKNNIYLNLVLLAVVFLFCVMMGWLWVRHANKKEKSRITVKGNKVVNNKVDKDVNIGIVGSNIVNNKIKGNKVKGNLNVGGK